MGQEDSSQNAVRALTKLSYGQLDNITDLLHPLLWKICTCLLKLRLVFVQMKLLLISVKSSEYIDLVIPKL